MLSGTAPSAPGRFSAGSAIAPSLVYRYSVAEKDWDAAYRVGRVPKYVALSPDDSRLLVTNWCDATMSILDAETGEMTPRPGAQRVAGLLPHGGEVNPLRPCGDGRWRIGERSANPLAPEPLHPVT